MIDVAAFNVIVQRLGQQGEDDIAWAEALGAPPQTADEFAVEAIFVICNSGMRYTVARKIFDAVMQAIRSNLSASTAFGHEDKAFAIDWIWAWREQLFGFYSLPWCAARKLDVLAMLPWVGEITKFHLAKNFGLDLAKPDVHLQRLANREGVTVQALCERLAKATGYRVATVDTVLWRACATGVLNSRTGQLREAA